MRLPRNEVRGIERRPAPMERLLRLAWLCELPDPESMPVDELKDALEARGYAVDAAGKTQPAALDRLLPPTPEPEATWLARRAATELAVDSGPSLPPLPGHGHARPRGRTADGCHGPLDGRLGAQAAARPRPRPAGRPAGREAQSGRGPGPDRRRRDPAGRSRPT